MALDSVIGLRGSLCPSGLPGENNNLLSVSESCSWPTVLSSALLHHTHIAASVDANILGRSSSGVVTSLFFVP